MKVVAFPRAQQGTGASRRLRKAGQTPGIIYGSNEAPVNITLDHNALYHALKKEAFHSSVLDMEIDGKTQKVLLRDFQVHAFKQLVLHVDFQRVDANKKLHVKVPLRFVNADASPAVKLGGALVSTVLNELAISCLPKDLPESIEVDLSKLEASQSVHVSDITLPAGVEVVSQENQTLAVAGKGKAAAPVEGAAE